MLDVGDNSTREVCFDFITRYTLEQVHSINRSVAFANSIDNFPVFKDALCKEFTQMGLHGNRYIAQATLEIKAKHGKHTACLYRIKNEVTIIGRNGSCSVILSEKTVSSNHAKIVMRGNSCFIMD